MTTNVRHADPFCAHHVGWLLQAPSSSCANKSAPDSQAESAFLQCLSKLNDDTFCQVLLPQLKADRSAGSLAATCSQLRSLCHNSIERLDMSPLINNHAPSAAEQWTQGLQEHFPHCSSVALCVQEKRSYHAVTYMLPALARCVCRLQLTQLIALVQFCRDRSYAWLLPLQQCQFLLLLHGSGRSHEHPVKEPNVAHGVITVM